MSGKGSRPRPYSVDQKTFDTNWDRIFSKNNQQHQNDAAVHEITVVEDGEMYSAETVNQSRSEADRGC